MYVLFDTTTNMLSVYNFFTIHVSCVNYLYLQFKSFQSYKHSVHNVNSQSKSIQPVIIESKSVRHSGGVMIGVMVQFCERV